jgi:general secretion pathway protein I
MVSLRIGLRPKPGPASLESAGFSLLEVMVSLAILALALTAIAGINATSFEESNYAKYISTATLLARSKMIDIEEKLRKDGLDSDDKEYDGDFEAEGYPGMKWLATSRKIEVDVAQLIGGLFGGDVSADSLPEQMQTFLGAMKGEGPGDLKDKVGGSDLTKLLGGGGMEMIYKQVGDTLGKSIREITLEITWGTKGRDEESIKFVQYVTTTGRLAVPQGGANPLAGLNAASVNDPNNPNAQQQNPAAGPAGGILGQGTRGGNPSGLGINPANVPGASGIGTQITPSLKTGGKQ